MDDSDAQLALAKREGAQEPVGRIGSARYLAEKWLAGPVIGVPQRELGMAPGRGLELEAREVEIGQIRAVAERVLAGKR